MIDLYTWSTPNGRKISIALEELGARVHGARYRHRQEPAVRSGVPRDQPEQQDSRDRRWRRCPRKEWPRMMESGAILLYLADKCGQAARAANRLGDLAVADAADGRRRSDARPGSSLPSLQSRQVRRTRKSDSSSRPQRLYGVFEHALGEAEYLAGEYSIADIATWPWISRYEWQQIDLRRIRTCCAGISRLPSGPAVQRGYDVPAKVGDIPRPASKTT